MRCSEGEGRLERERKGGWKGNGTEGREVGKGLELKGRDGKDT